ncbi:MAG TPA: class I SAM-dependent methyltransferase [Anaerolineales bacterium]|nr:class I SAM-dependent methyltransferase [Anaerolineales bacterium]
MRITPPDLYRKFFIDRDFERLDLFQLIAEKYHIQRALYAGSFVHVTPSFVIPDVVYVDNDNGAKKFFADSKYREFVAQQKSYSQDAKITFHFADYRDRFDERDNSFDLLISQYAGFVGQYCKRYLKKGGLLLANNSHGDAGVAAIDKDYQLTAVVSLRNGKYRISEDKLEEYFVPRSSKVDVTKEHLIELQRGIGYKKTASMYVFKKLK